MSAATYHNAAPAPRIIWILGRRIVVLERRGATWRMSPRAS